MLSYEWRELEAVCQRISELRDRYAHARRSQNHGLVEGVKQDLARARRHRERLVQQISDRLGTAAIERHHPASTQSVQPASADSPTRAEATLGLADQEPTAPL